MLRRAQDAIAAKRFVQTPSAEAHVRKRNLRDALHIAADVADVMGTCTAWTSSTAGSRPVRPADFLQVLELLGASVVLRALMLSPAACADGLCHARFCGPVRMFCTVPTLQLYKHQVKSISKAMLALPTCNHPAPACG